MTHGIDFRLTDDSTSPDGVPIEQPYVPDLKPMQLHWDLRFWRPGVFLVFGKVVHFCQILLALELLKRFPNLIGA